MEGGSFELGADNLRLAGWSRGTGREVVLLHGGPGLSDYMDSLAPELGDGYRLVSFQQRGLAPSTTAGPFDVATHVEDTLRVVEHLRLRQPVLVGHSWGGHLALHLLVAHADRFAAALIIDPLGALPDGGFADLGRNLGERIGEEARVRAEELDERALHGEGTDEEQLEGLALVWPGYFADPATAPPMPAMRISTATYAATFTSIQAHFERGTLAGGLGSVRLPVTVLLGEQSPIPNSYGAATAALMPNAELRIAPGVGHLLWMERPGLVRSELDLLCARAEAPAVAG